jgi:hypothetical protein
MYELKFCIIFRRNSIFKGLITFSSMLYGQIHGRKLFKLLWGIEPVLGNDRETNYKKADQIHNKQQLNYNNIGTVGNDIFYMFRAERLYNEDTSQARVSWKSVCEEKTRKLV